MATKKKSTKKAPESVARETAPTSNDGRFSTYERVQVPGGELILQHRGAPDKKTPPGDA